MRTSVLRAQRMYRELGERTTPPLFYDTLCTCTELAPQYAAPAHLWRSARVLALAWGFRRIGGRFVTFHPLPLYMPSGANVYSLT
jgi:hypothetical protein